MKQTKHWVMTVITGIASVLICVLLVISSNFTFAAKAADVALTSVQHYYLPLIIMGSPSSTTIMSHIPDPSEPGQLVVVGVTVSGAGIPVPTGTVDITGADVNCSILLGGGGSGSCGVIFNTTGHKTLTAKYNGDGYYIPSEGTASHIVVQGSATTLITADIPDPSIPGQAVAISFSVFGAGVTPTGKVFITGANINCNSTLSEGTGSCYVVFNTIGAKTLTATYSGDSNYLPNTDTEPHAVKNATITTITSDNIDPSTPGVAITVCFTVSGAGPVPTGDVIITGADGGPYPPVTLDPAGKGCLLNVIFNTAGAKILTATYTAEHLGVPDPNYVGSMDTESHTVNKGTTETSFILVDPSPSQENEEVTVTVGVHGGGVPPTGSIGISVAGQPSATCTISPLIPTGPNDAGGSCVMDFVTHGTWTIAATYSGDENYLTSMITQSHTVLTPL